MRLTRQHRNLRPAHELDSLVEARILEMRPRLRIDEARVRLECVWDERPAYRVAIRIATRGPRVEAEGVDRTVLAAVGKALADLQRRLRRRQNLPGPLARGHRRRPKANGKAAPVR